MTGNTCLLVSSRPQTPKMVARTNVYLRSVAPPQVARRRKILRSTLFHTSKSHSAAPGMHAYCARELRAKMHEVTSVCCCLLCIFFRGGQTNPIQSKQVELSLATYLCLHHTRLYYFSTYCTRENSTMAFMATL